EEPEGEGDTERLDRDAQDFDFGLHWRAGLLMRGSKTLGELKIVSARIEFMAARRTKFGRDSGLQARMLLTIFLLGLLYVVFVAVLFTAGAGAGIIVTVAVVLLLVQLFASDKIALETQGVKEVSPAEEPELHGIVERLCVQADLPKPRVCVMETPMPNAFAMGRSQKSTTVCATRGILDMLDSAEL